MNHLCKLLFSGLIAAVMLPLLGAEPLVRNSSFEEVGRDALPTGWSWRVSGNAKCTVAFAGKGVLKIQNKSPMAANVYSCLGQWLKLTPGSAYRLNVRAKGDGRGLQVAIGKGWNLRFQIEPLNSEWHDYVFLFNAPEETEANGLTPFDIICDNIAPEIRIDRVEVEPVVTLNLDEKAWQDARVYGVREVQGDFAAINSIPSGLPGLQIPRSPANTVDGMMPAKQNLSAEIALGRDSVGLLFFAKISDDLVNVKSEEEMWNGDCVQLRIDRAGSRLSEAAPTDLEVGFTVGTDGKVHNWCWDSGSDSFSHRTLPPELLSTHGFRTAAGCFIAARLDWKLLGGIEQGGNGKFGFTVAVNDVDRKGDRKVYFLTPGLHDKKYSDQYIQALFQGDRPIAWVWLPAESDARFLKGMLLASGEEGPFLFNAELTDQTGKHFKRELGRVSGAKRNELIKVPFEIPLDPLAKGNYTADFQINGRSVRKVAAAKINLYEQQIPAVAQLMTELTRLNREFDAFYGKRPRSEYVAAPLNILNCHLSKLANHLTGATSDDMKKYYAEQAAMTNADIAGTLTDLDAMLKQLKSGKTLPPAWTFRSSAIKLVGGWPTATAMNDRGERVERPIVCVGYGAFADIERDIAKFQNMGADTVQVETGPLWLFPREGKNREFEPDFQEFDSRFTPLMKKAWENNVKIQLLISPHYCPDWLLAKYPEMKSASGFIKYEVTHPKAIEMLKAYVPAIIGRLKAGPYAGALHSICLSNEPYYTNCALNNPYSVAMFAKYMTRKYGPVEKFNVVAKKNFKSYEEVAAAVKRDKAAKFEFYNFAKNVFADWHRMLSDEVHKVWADMPVHTKIIVSHATFAYDSGVDPELMAGFSGYNGNDTYFFSVDDWHMIALSHEIQVSSNPVSIADTENHIIRDRETQPISNDYIYLTLFQQYITGVSTMITWVYADVDYAFARQNPKDDLLGNIYLRPGNLATHAKAGLDGMRLAPELQKFMQNQPETAVLYAPTAILLNQDSYKSQLDKLYTELCFTGYRPRTLSERQLAAGDFGKTKVLFVSGAANLSRAALAGMAKFAEQGGRIIADVQSLKEDEFGNPVTVDFPVERTADLNSAALTAQITRSIKPLPVQVKVSHDAGNRGIFFRMVPVGDGSWLVNLVNYNPDRRRIKLVGDGEWFDLIREETFNPDFELIPIKPQLLRFTPAKGSRFGEASLLHGGATTGTAVRHGANDFVAR